MSGWSEIRATLAQPEYVHVLLNPLPVYGMAVSVLAGILARVFRSRDGGALALGLVLLAGLSAWPVAHFGSAGYDRVYSMSGPQAQKWLNWHSHLAARAEWACYAAAFFSALGLVARRRAWRYRKPFLALAWVSAILALACGGLTAFAGGRIRHSEFRSGAPPAWADTSSDSD